MPETYDAIVIGTGQSSPPLAGRRILGQRQTCRSTTG